MLSRIAFVIGMTLLIIGCRHASEPNSISATGSIIPLKIGNYWEYTRTWSRLDSVSVDTGKVKMEVLRIDTLDSFIGYYLSNLIIQPFSFDYSTPIVANRSDGLYTADIAVGLYTADRAVTVPLSSPRIAKALAYPTNVGDSIQYLQYIVFTDSVSTKITEQAGSFECIKYSFLQNGDTVAVIWSKPDFGIVRSWVQYGLVRYTYDLFSFYLL